MTDRVLGFDPVVEAEALVEFMGGRIEKPTRETGKELTVCYLMTLYEQLAHNIGERDALMIFGRTMRHHAEKAVGAGVHVDVIPVHSHRTKQ